MESNLLTNNEIRDFIDIIIKYKNSDEMKKLKKKSNEQFIEKLTNNFTFFQMNYPTIFDLIIKNENLEYLTMMLDMKDKIDSGQESKENVEKNIGELLAKDFIYPIIKK